MPTIPFVVLSSLLLVATPLAHAQAPLCDVSDAHDKEFLSQSEASARLAAQAIKTAEAFQKLMDSRKWKEGVPMSEQMTADEADRFGALRQTMASQNLASLYESKRERDIQVVTRLARLADQVGRYGFEAPKDKKSEDYFLYGVLFALREMVPVDPDKIAEMRVGETCDISNALLSASKRALEEAFGVPGLEQASRAVRELETKYGELQAGKMSKLDRQNFLEVYVPIVRKSAQHITLAEDLLRLRLLDQVSKLMLKGWRQDQYESPGDIAHAGSTWSAWVSDGRVTKRQHEMTSVINLINENIPADIVQGWSDIPAGIEAAAK
jgi:hypothetical protein